MKPIICLGELLVDLIPTKPVRLGEPCYTPYAGEAALLLTYFLYASIHIYEYNSIFIGTIISEPL